MSKKTFRISGIDPVTKKTFHRVVEADTVAAAKDKAKSVGIDSILGVQDTIVISSLTAHFLHLWSDYLERKGRAASGKTISGWIIAVSIIGIVGSRVLEVGEPGLLSLSLMLILVATPMFFLDRAELRSMTDEIESIERRMDLDQLHNHFVFPSLYVDDEWAEPEAILIGDDPEESDLDELVRESRD